jgi:anti-sigma regulatory factor (Ser/Thr protein kinase)
MLNAIKSRQKDLPAMVGIGVGLALIGIGPRWFFATELAITKPYGTDVLGQMILGMIPLVAAGYLFTDTLLYNRYIERSQRTAKKGWLILAFCLFYGLTLGWLWFFVHPGELLIFDRAIVIVLVAALFLDWEASLVIGLFAVIVRGALILLLETDSVALLGTVTDLTQAPAFLLDHRWVWHEPGILALLTALIFGIVARAYHHHNHQQQQYQVYPIWIGFPCAMLIEVVYLASVYWGWERGAFIDLTVNYAIPDILGIGAPTLLLLLLMDAAMAEAERKRAQEAELALEKTKLLYLQSQINPHFLFNALTTIQGLTYDQPAKARDLLVHLGDMYEMIARYRNHLIALEQELEHVRSYLVIATARWPDRLQIEEVIADNVNRQQLVPALILQPLVENAVEHGIAPKPGGGIIAISITETQTFMIIEIRDNGMGMTLATNKKPNRSQESGIGLQNVVSRLQTLYGPAYAPQIHSEVGKGTVIILTIPKAQ